MRRAIPFAAAALTALAAWLSFGVIGIDTPAGARIAALPVDPLHIAIAVAAAAAVWWRTRESRRGAAAVLPLLLVLLPWLPFRVPAAFLAWSGALVTIVWLAVGATFASQRFDRRHMTIFVNRATMGMVATIAAVVFGLSAWALSAVIPGGDEPHYLVITQSLLYDGDLQIENNHARGDYHAYFAGELRPDVIRRGRNGQVYSIHAPGVSALVAPAFALGGYPAAVAFLVLVSAAAIALAWWLAARVTGSATAALFGVASVALSAPYLLHTFTVYPDGPASAVVLTGFWALLRTDWEKTDGGWRRWFLHGLALALLPWMHTRFAVLAGTLGGLVLVRLARTTNASGKGVAFLIAPALSAFAWVAFFVVVYGTPDPSAPYGGSIQSAFAYVPDGAGGLLFDQGFGLLATAPVLLFAFAGFTRARRLALEWLIVAIPYLLAVTSFAMWWAGWAAPARFFVPVLLPLAIPAACAWQAIGDRATRATAVAALVVTCWITIVLVTGGGGRLAFHTRNEAGATAAPWLEWADPLVDLSSGLPAFVPLPAGTGLSSRVTAAKTGFVAVLPWAACLGIAWLGLRYAARRRLRDAGRLGAATTLAYGVAAMAALSAVWALARAQPVTPGSGQMDVLRRAASGPVVAIDLERRRRISRDELPSRIRVAGVVPRPAGRGRLDRPLFSLARVPAGEYRVTARGSAAAGWLMTGIGNDQFALVTEPVSRYLAGVRVAFPVDVRAIVVRGDEDARQQVDTIEVAPVRVLRTREKLSDEVALHAVRYASATVFFLDDRSFPEPGAFWVGGARRSTIVVAPDRPGAVRFDVRNAPVENAVTIDAGALHRELRLAAGEAQQVEVPLDPARGAVLVRITSSTGFRPSAIDPKSRDGRFLGVMVRLE